MDEMEINRGLDFIDALPPAERTAFLGLFAGARFPWTLYDDGGQPFIGKAECGWVNDWLDFYSRRLPAAGLFEWSEGDSGPALGMIRKENGEYHTWTTINCGPTQLGRKVRNAWWERLADKTDVLAALSDQPPSGG